MCVWFLVHFFVGSARRSLWVFSVSFQIWIRSPASAELIVLKKQRNISVLLRRMQCIIKALQKLLMRLNEMTSNFHFWSSLVAILSFSSYAARSTFIS